MFKYKLIDCLDFADSASFEARLSGVCDERKIRISKLKNEKARLESLGSSIALEELLGACEINGPFIFAYGKTGKPYLTNKFSDGKDVYISMTHKYPVAGAAVSDVPIGIDIEKVGAYKTGIAERFFTENEQAFISETNDESERQLRFYKVWTFKEAYCKCKDISLSENLNTLEYDEKKCKHFVEGDFLVTICEGV